MSIIGLTQRQTQTIRDFWQNKNRKENMKNM